jgi:hypothetical protein
MDSAARALDGTARLGGSVHACAGDEACARAVAQFLEENGVARVTGWSERVPRWGDPDHGMVAAPPADGHSALTDGTYVRVAGGKEPAGDPIGETFTWRGRTVTVDAQGLFAIRFAADGKVAALAAGGLKRLKADGLEISLPEGADLALVRAANGKLQGVLQGWTGEIPPALKALTPHWERLAIPPPLAHPTEPLRLTEFGKKGRKDP